MSSPIELDDTKMCASVLQENTWAFSSRSFILDSVQAQLLYKYNLGKIGFYNSSAITDINSLMSNSVSGRLSTQDEIYLTSEISNKVVQIRELYHFEDSKEMRHFLQTSSYLVDFLLSCHNRLQEHFLPKEITINLVSDHSLSDWNTLNISIRQEIEYGEALDKLDRFIEDWYSLQSVNIRKKVTFSVE